MSEESKANGTSQLERLVMPVCFLMSGTTKIYWKRAVGIKNGKIYFEDGGWNPISSCFFTEKQCRKHHGLPPKEWADTKRETAKALREMADSLEA